MTNFFVLSIIGAILFIIFASIFEWVIVRVKILGILTIELEKNIKKRKKTRD